jgi:hypothetical protein
MPGKRSPRSEEWSFEKPTVEAHRVVDKVEKPIEVLEEEAPLLAVADPSLRPAAGWPVGSVDRVYRGG